jgi:hypothetical protein
MENPVTTMRGDLNRLQFCRKHGLSYVTMTYIELGTQNLGNKTAVKLSKISGEAPERIKEDFQAWKQGRESNQVA